MFEEHFTLPGTLKKLQTAPPASTAISSTSSANHADCTNFAMSPMRLDASWPCHGPRRSLTQRGDNRLRRPVLPNPLAVSLRCLAPLWARSPKPKRCRTHRRLLGRQSQGSADRLQGRLGASRQGRPLQAQRPDARSLTDRRRRLPGLGHLGEPRRQGAHDGHSRVEVRWRMSAVTCYRLQSRAGRTRANRPRLLSLLAAASSFSQSSGGQPRFNIFRNTA